MAEESHASQITRAKLAKWEPFKKPHFQAYVAITELQEVGTFQRPEYKPISPKTVYLQTPCQLSRDRKSIVIKIPLCDIEGATIPIKPEERPIAAVRAKPRSDFTNMFGEWD